MQKGRFWEKCGLENIIKEEKEEDDKSDKRMWNSKRRRKIGETATSGKRENGNEV